ncbi:MAG TPA: hypothetical protein VIO14_01300 [Dehalococcoidia bacterium]
MPAALLFLAGYLALWLAAGLLAWLVPAVRRRGVGTLPLLPAALAGAVLGGLLVPLLGLRDASGVLLSIPAAFAAALASALAAGTFGRKGGNGTP